LNYIRSLSGGMIGQGSTINGVSTSARLSTFLNSLTNKPTYLTWVGFLCANGKLATGSFFLNFEEVFHCVLIDIKGS
jgi:hypothetical protein